MNYHFTNALIRPYTISFKRPLTFNNIKHNFKRGYFLTLKDNHNNIATGELPFIEGIHSGDPLEHLKSLEFLSLNILNKNIDLKNIDFRKAAFNLFSVEENDLPLFCLEGALLSWLEKTNPNIIKNFFKGQLNVPVNGLFIPSKKEDPKALVENWKEKGFKTVKIKIGNLSFKEELQLIWKLYKEANKSFKIRLDGNQKFSNEDFFFMAKNLPADFIDYIEDPIEDSTFLETVHEETKISFAFDEQLKKGNFKKEKYLKAWVIKPSLWGGISKSIQMIDLARKQNILAVISSAYESKITLKHLAALASYQNQFQKTDCGLHTFENFIDDDSLENPILKKGMLSFS